MLLLVRCNNQCIHGMMPVIITFRPIIYSSYPLAITTLYHFGHPKFIVFYPDQVLLLHQQVANLRVTVPLLTLLS